MYSLCLVKFRVTCVMCKYFCFLLPVLVNKDEYISIFTYTRVYICRVLKISPNSTWLDSTRHVRLCRASRASRASRDERVERDEPCCSNMADKFSRFFALVYTNPICFVK